jgi:hypothetical protein
MSSNLTCEPVAPSGLALELIEHWKIDGTINCYRWLSGKSAKELPWLQIVEISSDYGVHYVTAGASRILDRPGYGTEFCYVADSPDVRNIELLSMVAYLHSKPDHRLGVGHTMNIGRPITPSSTFDRLLVSLPYVFGSDFEYMHCRNGDHVRILWLLPISSGEERLRHAEGLEKLEHLFELAQIDFLDSMRPDVSKRQEDLE